MKTRTGEDAAPDPEALKQAREAALSLLAHRARSTREIERRLARKGHEPTTIQGVVAWLEELDYLDDEAFAVAFVRDRVRFHPRGRRLLRRELGGKGIPQSLADRAIERAARLEELDFEELARRVARRWLRRHGSRRASDPDEGHRTGRWRPRPVSRKLRDHLARKGFGAEAQRAGLDVLDEVGEEPGRTP